MSKHLFGAILTAYGTAANNRGETEGNITTLQKLLWQGKVHTTISAEAIRWAVRYYWQRLSNGNIDNSILKVNRIWNEQKNDHEWQKATFSEQEFIDDDVLGYMHAEGAKVEGNDDLKSLEEQKKQLEKQKKDTDDKDKEKEIKAELANINKQIKDKKKGTAKVRRGILELSRAVSLIPFSGDITFNAKSGEKGRTSLYGTELHATRYQYGFAFTPESLTDPKRAPFVLDAIVNLGEVAGNHSRYLYDFSPEILILRWTDDFSPRILYSFETDNSSKEISIDAFIKKVESRDINPDEVHIGGPLPDSIIQKLNDNKVHYYPGVKQAAEKVKSLMTAINNNS